MKKNSIACIGFIALLTSMMSACYYDTEEELYPKDLSACDTTTFTFAKTIQPILTQNCTSCHAKGIESGGIRLDTYTDVERMAKNGKLYGAVNHLRGYVPMPQNAPKLAACKVLLLKKWLDAGAPNN